MGYSHEREIALTAVAQASKITQKVRFELVEADSVSKTDTSPVTIADFSSQAHIAQALIEHFPQDNFIAEESSSQLLEPSNRKVLERVLSYVGQFHQATAEQVFLWIDHGNNEQGGKRYWTLDPVDGTRGFLRNDQYAIALALIEGGVTKVGALACPNLAHNFEDPQSERGILFSTVRGEGLEILSLQDLSPLRDFSRINPAHHRLVESFEAVSSDQGLQEAIGHELSLEPGALKMDSQTKYGILVLGQATVYLRLPPPHKPGYRENIWDHAAGSIVVQEAGGTVTDSVGNTLDFTSGRKMSRNSGIVATMGIDHSRVLEVVKQLSSSRQ